MFAWIGVVTVCFLVGCGKKAEIPSVDPNSVPEPPKGGPALPEGKTHKAPTDATHAEIQQAMLDGMTEMTAILSAVKDKKTADAAKPDLKTQVEKMNALQKQAQEMPEPPKIMEKELKEKFESKMTTTAKKLGAEIDRVAAIDGAKDLLSVFPQAPPAKKG
ncbi:MAG: hypothetical protein AUJ92_20195 [Armatimonadetes bacterium CG2_30_59_28]|nr:MAG: hypothetical protein AUJ92_20195 [Armatimonadetes bacterium CG2_30_59_28]PIU66853.1 MAG: hypothetical protein COS85_02905 [Armatimonadetes bacterium CG07_land_8_20_14_0_80_59_28]PIX43767.1 MAG: hypothetical protein COZ56_06350 [Armatimonadetes bacterium CG_4_8_14_3_um_filter_58_9]PIY47427.1 MAG: hypothetical protein COZ05_04935 [Armatimonadetes bacterium CG_4_10_14_3_um_filter_59_10]